MSKTQIIIKEDILKGFYKYTRYEYKPKYKVGDVLMDKFTRIIKIKGVEPHPNYISNLYTFKFGKYIYLFNIMDTKTFTFRNSILKRNAFATDRYFKPVNEKCLRVLFKKV